MSLTATALRELHRIHQQFADLNDRLASGPRQIKVIENQLAAAEKRLEEVKEHHKRTRMNRDQRELQLKQRESKVEDLKVKLNTCSTNKEFQMLKDQIAADIQANSVLADEILELMEQTDEEATFVADHVDKVKASQSKLNEVKTKVDSERENLESERARVGEELAKAEDALPSDIKVEYRRIADARGEGVLAAVSGECCGGCFQRLTPQTFNLLMMETPVFCKACGCLIYLPEDTSLDGDE
ncbi:MAG: putative nucleic acid-binding Zn-ribbon protein [Pirellulaceae bacterium]|jgi:predicted  nucleic acid-binding Zn-ribbon protein